MAIYNKNGGVLVDKRIYVGAVLDASSETNRFLAMKQLFDLAEKKVKNPSYVPEASEFTYATKGAVMMLPQAPSAMFEKYSLPVLFSQNATVQSIPASTTKVMSAITAIPYIKSIKDTVTLVSGDIETGSGNYFSAGDVLTIEDLLFGMFLPSSNTCAKTLAHYVGGIILGSSTSVGDCVSAFVAEMNAKAAFIGCTNTIFDTPSGLSANTKSTATDLLRITLEACSCPIIQRIWNKASYDINVGGSNARTQTVTTTVSNATLEASYYIFGGKTGHITGSADALVMIAEKK